MRRKHRCSRDTCIPPVKINRLRRAATGSGDVSARARSARSSPTITQDQLIAWLRELLTGNSESLPYRIAGTLQLLYTQPIARIATHRTNDILLASDGPYLALGTHPAPIPTPFADMLTEHLAQRPNLHAVRDGESEWLFPGRTPGSHLHPNTIMNRLRTLGIDLRGTRTTAIRTLVTEVPAPIAADMRGFSQQIAAVAIHSGELTGYSLRFMLSRYPEAVSDLRWSPEQTGDV